MGCILPKNEGAAQGKGSQPQVFNEKLFRTVDFRLITSSYTVTSTVLGSGNFGKVYLAYHNVNSEFKVAVKTMHKKKIGDGVLEKLK